MTVVDEQRARETLAELANSSSAAFAAVVAFGKAAIALETCERDRFIEDALRDSDGGYIFAEEMTRLIEDLLVYTSLGTKIHAFERPLSAPATVGTETWVVRRRVPAPTCAREVDDVQDRLKREFTQDSDTRVVAFLDRYATRVRSHDRFLRACVDLGGVRLIGHRDDVVRLPMVEETTLELRRAGYVGQALRADGPLIVQSVAPEDPVARGVLYIVGEGSIAYDTGRLRVAIDGDWTFFQHERMRIIDPARVLRVEAM